ncbi:hypothetical protein [Acinetobacter sp. Marseille-Q1618]|uniref:hypothetical protein n=1 Tax=Acinetobacter sp. Marseille-Q1618 TaxID=2697502 RepID=UPI001570CA02|nr:hypothetical protein [Acinetobacter sp. Marseille-Q1618]
MAKEISPSEFSLAKESFDISHLVNDPKTKVIDQIVNKVKVHVQDRKDLGAVLLVGGGSTTLGERLINSLEYNSIHLVKDPELANARGLYKCAAFMAKT